MYSGKCVRSPVNKWLDLLPGEVLEFTFLYLRREDVEALLLSHRHFHGILSTERFEKVTPLRRLRTVNLIDDNLAMKVNRSRSGEPKRFRYDVEDVTRWLRNTCVEDLDMRASQEHGEQALRWFIAHRSEFRAVHIVVNLPLVNDALQEAFLRPDPAHHWTSVSIDGDLRGNLPLTSSALERVEHLYVHSLNLQVTVDDVVHWLHRAVPPFVGVNCRQLTLASENIEGGLLQLLAAVREKFMTATTSRVFGVTIVCRPDDILPANAHAAFRKYNRHAGDLMSIEVIAGGRFSGNEISIRRRSFP